MKPLALTISVMTLAFAIAALAEGTAAAGKETAMSPLSGKEKETIQKQVRDQFNQLISAINHMDASAWSEHYSNDGFLSAVAGTDFYVARSAWVSTITSYFAARKSQHVKLSAVQVTPLAPDLALLTSQEKSEMVSKNGQTSKSAHVFTMIWKKEQSGWKILHSHESWVDEPAK